MVGRISESDIAEVKARTNIADLISGYLSLRPSGPGSYKGLCPFHGEKTPSFTVRLNPPLFHCFGCGEGGDAVAFLQKMESLNFSEAIQRLADRSGIELKFDAGGQETSARNRLVSVNNAASSYFCDQLFSGSPDANRAMEFLFQRGFDESSLRHFEIGFAPRGWTNLAEHLKRKGFAAEELLAAGIVSQGAKGLTDRFRGRIIWPIHDVNGQSIGFGARRLFDDDTGPKYLNTPETLLYKKAQVLYGLDLARRDIVKKREIVVVEGYTDVMACHLAGVTNAVATCGTAFGEEHIRIINRMFGSEPTDQPAKVVFTFDPDSAGEKAALRVWANQGKFNALTFVAAGPDGLDPADLRQQRGDAAIAKMLELRRPLFEFVMRHRISNFDLRDVDSRIAAARSALPVLLELEDTGTRTVYLRQLSEWLSLSESELANLLARIASPTERKSSAAAGEVQSVTIVSKEREDIFAESQEDRSERKLLEVVIQHPEHAQEMELRKIAAAGLTTRKFQRILEAMLEGLESSSSELTSRLIDRLPSEATPLLRELAMSELPILGEENLLRYCRGVCQSAVRRALEREKTELLTMLRRTSPDDSEKVSAIQKQLIDLDDELAQLK